MIKKKKEFFYGGCGGEGENLLPEIPLKISFSEGGVNFDDLGGEGQFGRPFFKLVLFYMFYGSSMCIFILHLYQIVANL